MALVSTGAWGNGVGESTSCDSVMASYNQTSEKFHQPLYWVDGYIGATKLYRNAATHKVSLLGDTERLNEYILVSLAQYCLGNPSGRLADAAEAIVETIFEEE